MKRTPVTIGTPIALLATSLAAQETKNNAAANPAGDATSVRPTGTTMLMSHN